MQYALYTDLSHREKADLLVFPFWEGSEVKGEWKERIASFLRTGDFKGKNGETVFLYPEGEKEPRLLLLGLGKEDAVTPETLRRDFAAAVRAARSKKAKIVNFVLPFPKKLGREEALTGCFEGICLANYAFSLKHDSLKENPIVLIDKIGLIGLHSDDAKILDEIKTVVSNVFWVRDLVNRNSDDKVPEKLAEEVQKLAQSHSLEVEIFDKQRLEKEKMGLLLAVARGSSHNPVMIRASHRGNPHSQEHIVLVGKGVTYDTGGLSLKPTDGMLTMKCDMAGAATVLGAVRTAAELKLKVNVTAVAPVTENSIDAKSYKLGDVYRSYSGKTVEITNTDAEGRLILADALSYAALHFKPTCMIDLATLTGAMIVALGEEIAGLYAADEQIARDLLAASSHTSELLWRMPLHMDYKEQTLKSEIADMINSAGREAGSMKAAFFLQEFVGSVPWAHLDVAGPCFLTKPKHYNTAQGTGYGIRLLIDYLKRKSA